MQRSVFLRSCATSCRLLPDYRRGPAEGEEVEKVQARSSGPGADPRKFLCHLVPLTNRAQADNGRSCSKFIPPLGSTNTQHPLHKSEKKSKKRKTIADDTEAGEATIAAVNRLLYCYVVIVLNSYFSGASYGGRSAEEEIQEVKI